MGIPVPERAESNYSFDLGMSRGPEYDKGWYAPGAKGQPVLDPTAFVIAYINRYRVMRLNGQITAWVGSRYFCGDEALEGLVTYMDAGIPPAGRKDILARLHGYFRTRPESSREALPKFVKFRSSVLDVETGLSYAPEDVDPICNTLPWDYNPEAYDPGVDKMLNDVCVNDPTVRTLLEEMIGYCLYRSLRFRKMFILTGGKRNGKSTFLELLAFAIGQDNMSSLGFQDYNEQFLRPQLYGKLVNLGDDISDRYIQETDIMKKLVSGEPVQAANKYEKPFIFRNYATSIFSSNSLPKVNDPTGAVMDRIIIIPFKAYFSESEADLGLIDRLKTKQGAEYLLALGINALKRLLKQSRFSVPEDSAEAHQTMVQDNDHIKDWLAQFDPLWQTSEAVYASYVGYCEDEHITKNAYSKRGVSRAVNSNLGTWLHKYSNQSSIYEPASTKGKAVKDIENAKKSGWTGREQPGTAYPAVGKFPKDLPDRPLEEIYDEYNNVTY